VHELAICQGLINQVERLAMEYKSNRIDTIVLSIGPLSGVEPPLLRRAFDIACLETVAKDAELRIETGPVVVECRSCGASGEVQANCLLCPTCGDWQVSMIQGDELLLLSIEVSDISEARTPPSHR
jgi:hydrogenase nickel incorporation protein HypA/HybF